jgi:hypothetical protein
MLSVLEVVGQGSSLSSRILPQLSRMAKRQSSVLAGDSGDGGRQLRQGSGDGAHLPAVGPPLGGRDAELVVPDGTGF